MQKQNYCDNIQNVKYFTELAKKLCPSKKIIDDISVLLI